MRDVWQSSPGRSAGSISSDQGASASPSYTDGCHALLILGMRCRDTSLVAPACKLIGPELGLELSGTPSGDWQHQAVAHLHDRVLRTLGSSWDDCRALPDGWHQRPDIREFHPLVHEVIARGFDGGALLAVDEPGLCRLLPLWLDVLAAQCAPTHCLIVLSDPAEVADALTARNGFSREKGLLLWLRTTLDLERHSRGVRRAFVTGDELSGDGRAALVPVAAGNGIARGAAALGPHAGIPGIVELTANTLALLAKRDDREGCALMDEIAQDLGGISSLYDAVLGEQQAQLTRRDNALRTADGAVAAREAETEALEATVAEREARLQALETAVAAGEARIQALESTLAAREARIGELGASLATREAQIMELGEFIDLMDCRVSEILRSRSWTVGAFVGGAFHRLVPNALKRPAWSLARRSFQALRAASVNEEIVLGREIISTRLKAYDLLESLALHIESGKVGDMDDEISGIPKSIVDTIRSSDNTEPRPPMDIIIYAHTALDDIRDFLTSLIRNADMAFTLHLVNDGPEEQTSTFLQSITEAGNNCELIDSYPRDELTDVA